MSDEVRRLLLCCVAHGVGVIREGRDLRLFWRDGFHPAVRAHIIALKASIVEALGEPAEGPGDPRWGVDLLADLRAYRAWVDDLNAGADSIGPPDQESGWAAYLRVKQRRATAEVHFPAPTL